jgi:hypothetical protein
MNCQKFENRVGELARGRMMAAEQRGAALAHTDACEDCAARLQDEEMLTRGLQSLATEMEVLAAPGQLENTLLAAFRARQVAGPISSRRSSSRYWLAAVAAILLIVMSVVAVRWRAAVVDVPTQVAKEKTPPEEPRPVDKPSDQSPKEVEYRVENVSPQRSIRRASRHARLRASDNAQLANHVSEIATDFIPLSYMSAANLQDGGQIVRVELPRSALANFGLPVNMERYNERVKADVLLGVDGLAHAIRFVQ